MRKYRSLVRFAVVLAILSAWGVLSAATTSAGPASPAASQPAGAGVPFDLQKFIDNAVQAGKKKIVVPPGRYRVTPKSAQHLLLANLADLEIVADGVEMICTETTRAVTISHCKNVTLRGLTIDYDPLPFTQGRIVAMADDKKWVDIEIFDGYPDEGVQAVKTEFFDAATGTLKTGDYGVTIEKQAPRKYRITKTNYRYDKDRHVEQVGDIVATAATYAPHGNAGHAIYIEHCAALALESVTLYASNCFGFLEMECDGTRYLRCRIDRCPPADDIRRRSSPRLRSLNADAYHSVNATKGPAYEQCAARFMGDDCINIHGDYHMVMASAGGDLRVLAKHGMSMQAGDPVELTCYDGRRLADAKIVAISPAGAIRDEERAFLLKQHMNESHRTAKGSLTRAYSVTLDREQPMAMGGVIASTNRMGSGFLVKGCDFGFNRSRGILIKASHGEISGNRMEGCWMSAILVSPEFWWLESGSSDDVKITGNTIVNCKGVAILVEAPSGSGVLSPAGAHKDITITGNIIKGCKMPGILVASTRGLTIADNTLDLQADPKALPWIMRKAGLKEPQPIVQIATEP